MNSWQMAEAVCTVPRVAQVIDGSQGGLAVQSEAVFFTCECGPESLGSQLKQMACPVPSLNLRGRTCNILSPSHLSYYFLCLMETGPSL